MTDELEKYRLKMRCLELAVGKPDPLKAAGRYYDWVMGAGKPSAITDDVVQEWGAQIEKVVNECAAATKPSDPATAPTVAPYEGCWATLRNGAVVDIYSDQSSGQFINASGHVGWGADGRFYAGAPGATHKNDIIAVHASDPRIVEFTPWRGGERPCEGQVEVELRSGETFQYDAKHLRWTHGGGFGDIVGYRRLS